MRTVQPGYRPSPDGTDLSTGGTPLWVACCNRHPEVARLLLQYEADPDAEDLVGLDDAPYVHTCMMGNPTATHHMAGDLGKPACEM